MADKYSIVPALFISWMHMAAVNVTSLLPLPIISAGQSGSPYPKMPICFKFLEYVTEQQEIIRLL